VRRQLIIGPSIGDIRKTKAKKQHATDRFPVIDRLEEILAGVPVQDPLDKAGRNFDPDQVARYVCATLSSWAYSDLETVATMMTRLGLPECRCRAMEVTNSAALIRSTAYLIQSQSGKVALLAYRGTDPFDLATWAVNADLNPSTVSIQQVTGPNVVAATSAKRGIAAAPAKLKRALRRKTGQSDAPAAPAPANEGFVHAGFYRNQRATWFEIADALHTAVTEGSIFAAGETPNHWRSQDGAVPVPITVGPASNVTHLYITGHSQGAAMALLAAFKIASDETYSAIKGALQHVHLFAPPMVGNQAFADYVAKALPNKVSSYIYKNDVVPHLPPNLVNSLDFKHVGRFFDVSPDSATKPANECSWRLSPDGPPQRAINAGQLLLAFDAAFGDNLSLSRSALSIFRGTALEWAVSKIVRILVENRSYAIYDHFPTNYEACSQLADRKGSTEFGNDF
jgi:hypothetical protein